MVGIKKINKIAEKSFNDLGHINPSKSDIIKFSLGYKQAQKNMMKYKKAFDILNCYFDSISDEEQPKVAKQLAKLGV